MFEEVGVPPKETAANAKQKIQGDDKLASAEASVRFEEERRMKKEQEAEAEAAAAAAAAADYGSNVLRADDDKGADKDCRDSSEKEGVANEEIMVAEDGWQEVEDFFQ